MNEEQIRNQINDIIEGELQLGINEFLEEKQRKESDQGLGFVTSEEAKKLKVKVFKDEVDKIMKQYKKIKKKEKSNISQVKKLGLVDKHGSYLMDREKLKVMIKDLKNVVNALECEIYSDEEAYKVNLNYDEIVNHITDYDEVFEDDDG